MNQRKVVEINNLYKEVLSFLRSTTQCDLENRYCEIKLDTDLIATGILDSLTIVKFLMFLEETLNIEFPFDNFSIDSVASVNAIFNNYVK